MSMRIDMVYQYPIWAVSLLVVGASMAGALIVELAARRLIPFETRQRGNEVAAAMFSVIGVTFAVLLAFVVMLTFEGYMNAKVAATSEAMVARDVSDAAAALSEPARSGIQDALSLYLQDVVSREWPDQARGHTNDAGAAPLRQLHAIAAAYHPDGAGQTNAHAALISALTRLQDARAMRQLAAASTVPSVVWVVMLLGGALTVASGSFVAAPSARMHLAMSASGALVLLVVIVLSQPFRGSSRVSAAPYERVLDAVSARETGG